MNTAIPTRRTALWALGVLTAINLINYLDRYVVSAIVPDLKSSLALTDTELGGLMSAFMLVYGYTLCQATWDNSIAEFPWLRVGIAYSPIPFGGLITLLFIIEHLTIGRPRVEADPHGALPVE